MRAISGQQVAEFGTLAMWVQVLMFGQPFRQDTARESQHSPVRVSIRKSQRFIWSQGYTAMRLPVPVMAGSRVKLELSLADGWHPAGVV